MNGHFTKIFGLTDLSDSGIAGNLYGQEKMKKYHIQASVLRASAFFSLFVTAQLNSTRVSMKFQQCPI
jgi:hypothetical protein